MVAPNTEMLRADFIALVGAANAAATAVKLKRGPFSLFNPADAGGGAYYDITPPYNVTDAGAWAAGTYNAGQQVTDSGYLFISVINGNALKPMDATTGEPNAGWRQPWYSCYQRIRDEVHAGLIVFEQGGTVDLFKETVSGPWPCQFPNVNYDKLAFYFEDTGHAESVSISGTSGGSYIGKFQIGSGELVWDGSTFASTGGNPNVFSEPGNSVFNLDGSQSSIAKTWMDPAAAGQRRIIVSYVNSQEWEIVVGGTKPVLLVGNFVISASVIRGVNDTYVPDGTGTSFTNTVTVDAADPTGLLVIDVSGFIPGAAFTKVLNGPGAGPDMYDGITATYAINQTVNPGVYKVRATSAATPNFNGTGTLTEAVDGTFSGSNTWSHDTYLDIVGLEIDVTQSITIGVAVDANGIDDTKQVKKIAVNDFGVAGGFGLLVAQNYGTFDGLETVPGYPIILGPLVPPAQPPSVIFYIPGYTDPGTGNFPPFSEPIFSRKAYIQILGGVSITTTTTGYWLGVTPPVGNLGIAPYERMPWNQFPTNLPSSTANSATTNQYLGYVHPFTGGKNFTNTDAQRAYDYTDAPAWMTAFSPAVELLPWPKRWKPLVHYPKGFTILDSFGNFWKLIVQDARSGTTEPQWGTAITTEPNYSDFNGVLRPGAQWQLVKIIRPGATIKRNTPYALGDKGIDENGNSQRCMTAGTTNSTAPTWATVLAATTTDGTVIWKLDRVNSKLTPAIARISPPVYPCFWHNPVSQWQALTAYAADETITDSSGNTQSSSGGISGATEPTWGATTTDGSITWSRVRLEQPSLTDPNIAPITLDHPFSFKPQGWWIYRVFLSRIPQKKSTDKPSVTPVSVELGCVRNGVYVSFGTFPTGTPVDAMWPIFTNTALAIRCSERVDVQAEILTCGLGYGTWGNVSYPMAAAHINDIMAIIALL